MERTRVAFVASTLVVGGAERVMHDVVTRLARDRFETRVLLLREAGAVGRLLQTAGVPVESSLQSDRRDPRVLYRLGLRLRRFRPHVVYLLDHHDAIFWGMLAAVLARVPHRVVGSHATARIGGRGSFSRTDRLVMRAATTIVALSTRHARYLRSEERLDGRRIEVVANGIDVARYRNADPDAVARVRAELNLQNRERVVVMVAALRPEKAHEVLLESAKNLIPDFPTLRVLIAGDGPRRALLERMTRRLGVGPHVRFLGLRTDVPALLHNADVLVLPSRAFVETQPLSVLEAMAAGVPVVASAVGSVPDIVEDGVTGRLIAPADADGLTAALRAVFDDPGTARRMARRAAERVDERHTLTAMVARYEALFEGRGTMAAETAA